MRSCCRLSPRPPRRCSKQSKITMVSIYTLVASFLIHLQQLRRRIGGDSETCNTDTLLFVGRFDGLKGGDLMLRVFAELALSYPKLRLVFVGPGSRRDGRTRQEVVL